MITVRKSKDRGHANHGWLDSHHTFSFGDYHDAEHTGFHDLLVINEDRVQPGTGFATHGHKDMEIISYVLEGELAHKDSTGTGSVLKPGDVQRMSAGSGIRHSEYNGSKEKPVHFLQIWIQPKQEGIQPGYEEKKYSIEEKRNQLKLIVSPGGTNGSLRINQDAYVYASLLEKENDAALMIENGRHAWVQVARGTVELNSISLHEGDGAAISEETKLDFKAKTDSEFLIFDLP